MAMRFDAEVLLGRLEEIKFDGKADNEQSHFDQMSLGGVLLTLASINHEKEHELCRRAAVHLLGEVSEPEDIVVE